MSFLAWLVKTILNALDLDIPWRGVGTVMVAVLAFVAYNDRSDFTAGVHAWAVEAACQADHRLVSALSGDRQMPTMSVVKRDGGCTVTVSSPTGTAHSQGGAGVQP